MDVKSINIYNISNFSRRDKKHSLKKRLMCTLIYKIYVQGYIVSRPGGFFWYQYRLNWTIYYAAADKNDRGILCLQNQFFWHSRIAGEILAGAMYLIEGKFNVWWPTFGRQEVWQMSYKGHSGRHRSNHSNPTSQGHFRSFDGYLSKMFLLLLFFWSVCLRKIWIL